MAAIRLASPPLAALALALTRTGVPHGRGLDPRQAMRDPCRVPELVRSI